MERIAGITGGAVHFLLDDLAGQPFYAWSGSAYLNNRLFAGDGPAFRVNELSYEQNLCYALINDGVDVRLVQEFLGHASITSTAIYTAISPKRLAAVRVR